MVPIFKSQIFTINQFHCIFKKKIVIIYSRQTSSGSGAHFHHVSNIICSVWNSQQALEPGLNWAPSCASVSRVIVRFCVFMLLSGIILTAFLAALKCGPSPQNMRTNSGWVCVSGCVIHVFTGLVFIMFGRAHISVPADLPLKWCLCVRFLPEFLPCKITLCLTELQIASAHLSNLYHTTLCCVYMCVCASWRGAFASG